MLLIPMLAIFVLAVSAQNTEKTGSLLWKISGNGLAQPSFIFGTHHLYPVSFLDNVAGLKDAFASSKQVVGELLLQDMAALQAEMQSIGMMPQDSTWQMLLSAEDYQFVDERLTALFGAGLQAFGAFKPIMVSMTYSAVVHQQALPESNPGESMDLWFQQQAVSRGISVIGLETAHDQINALTIASLRDQAADLVCTLKNTDYTVSSARKLNRLYRLADLTGFSEMLREDSPCPWSADQEAALNDSRNKRWLEKLPAIMADKPSFVAVGCMHLVGDAGLLAGLEKAGYKVEAVR